VGSREEKAVTGQAKGRIGGEYWAFAKKAARSGALVVEHYTRS
jgi:hypothetical protein